MKAPVVDPGRKRTATGLFLKNSQSRNQQSSLLEQMRELLVAARDRRRIGADFPRELVDAQFDLLFHRSDNEKIYEFIDRRGGKAPGVHAKAEDGLLAL